MSRRIFFIIMNITLLLFFILSYLLYTNKTFFKTTYKGMNNQEMFIPQYSYFKEDCCMYCATFYSLRTQNDLENEINHYLKDFDYFENDETYGYKKDKLFIQEYKVEDEGLYRIIYIVY